MITTTTEVSGPSSSAFRRDRNPLYSETSEIPVTPGVSDVHSQLWELVDGASERHSLFVPINVPNSAVVVVLATAVPSSESGLGERLRQLFAYNIVDVVLRETYRRLDAGKLMDGLHHISMALDQWLRDGDRAASVKLFRSADVERLGIAGVKAIITDTRPAKEHFVAERTAFVERAVDFVKRVAPERAERLLRNMV